MSLKSEFASHILQFLSKPFLREYTLNMYKTATKVTRDETALVKGNTLATHLCSILFLLDLYHHTADLVVIGENQRCFVNLAHKVHFVMDILY